MFLKYTPDWLNKSIEYIFYFFFLIYPFFIFKSFLYQGSSSRFLIVSVVVAILMILVGFGLYKRKSEVSFLRSPIIFIFLIYFAYLFISAFLGDDFHNSFWSKIERTSALFFLLHLGFLSLLMIGVFDKEKVKDNILKIVVYSSALYSFLSALSNQGFKLIFKNLPYDGFLFGNSSFAAMYLLGAFLLSLYLIFRKEKIKWYEFIIPLLIIFNPFLFNFKIFYGGWSNAFSILGGAQASSVAMIISVIMLLAFYLIFCIKKANLKKWLIISFISSSVAMVSFVSYSLLSSDGFIRKMYEKQSTLARPVVWEISKNAIQDRPLTGWGIDNFSSAYQNNFDNRLLQQEYGEPWFDRAHNIILDQTVDTGYVGIVLYLLIYLIIIYLLTRTLLNTEQREIKVLTSILVSYFIVHFLELQTAFDTVASYVILSVMVSLSVLVVYNSDKREKTELNFGNNFKIILASFSVIFFLWSLFFGSIPFWKMQVANGEMRKVGTSDKRIPYYDKIFKTKVDRAGVLWRISNDFQKGISESPEIIENPDRAQKLLEELDLFTKEYEDYVSENPNNFRMKLNLADLYIYHLLFGVDMLDKADSLLDEAAKLVPNHPQPYVMKAVSRVYRNDFKGARMYVKKAEEINPNSVQVLRVKSFVEDSEKTFPEIDLFFFGQI